MSKPSIEERYFDTFPHTVTLFLVLTLEGEERERVRGLMLDALEGRRGPLSDEDVATMPDDVDY